MCVSILILSVFLFLSAPVRAQMADFDGDGTVAFADFLSFARAFGSADSTFDLNADGTVNFPDFLTFVQEYQKANPSPPPVPEISVSATSLAFGDVETGQSVSQTLTISNTGNAGLSVTGVASSEGQFSTLTGSFSVGTGGSQDVTVTFSPGLTGSISGVLTISSDDADEGVLSVLLSGNGIAPAPSLKQTLSILTPGSTRHTMILIPAGEITVEDQAGSHAVFLDNFYMDQFEVSNEQFLVFLNHIGGNQDPGSEDLTPLVDLSADGVQIRLSGGRFEVTSATLFNRPAVGITWVGANAYCRWMGGRLPTELEWEKAARGTDGRGFPWGNAEVTAELANARGNVGHTTDVDTYAEGASPYGMRHMYGNVYEWVSDIGNDGAGRVVLGGSWEPFYFRRSSVLPSAVIAVGFRSTQTSIGFRCARDPSP